MTNSGRFTFKDLEILGAKIIQCHPLGDDRGYLERMFCSEELHSIIGNRKIVQINHTKTAKTGTVRGMHFQYPPHAEMKLVSCLRGEVFDVAIDLRRDSPSFLKWHTEILSEDNHKIFAIPEGFAHGFQTLAPDCEMLYFHTADYNTDAEGALNACDPRLAINWPEPITERSERDASHAMLTDDFHGIDI